jgi:thioredoxin 1
MTVRITDFYADWCGPCKTQDPILDELEADYEDVEFAKVDVDEEQDVANQYQVRSLPTLVIENDDGIVDRFVGVTQREDLEAALEELEDLGWDIAFYGRLVMHATVLGMQDVLERFAEDGVEALKEDEEVFNERYGSVHHLAGMPEMAAIEKKYLPDEALDKYENATGHDITSE